jgi:PAS domain S-box-containing protein/putative nucleotidyltransferase with HDIG domain
LKHHDIYRYIVERALDGIYIVSQDRLEYVNAAFEKMTGISRNETHALGLDFLNLINPDDQKMLLERRKARKEGKPIPPTFEIKGTAKDGTQKYLEFNTTPVPGHADYVLGIVRDITERKLAEKAKAALKESEVRYKTIIETANDGIVIIQDGLITFANPFLLKNSGYTKEELIGKPFRNFIATDYLDQILDINERRKAGEAAASSYEAILKMAGGRRAFVEVNVSEITYHGKPGFFTVIHDITKHKEVETELRDTLGKLREAMNATTQAIAMIAEYRDPYTAGHQRRVADLGRAIAAEMGLSQEQIDAVRMAGLLHDIGKISIPAEILTKPTKLTETEFKLIKEHPQVAFDILKSIVFPWPIADIIYQHHERIDGSGYPRGLKGEDILIEAKVLAIADVVEAMITHRPYREARKLEDALREISTNRGILYDPEAADACLRALLEKGFSFRTDSAKREMPE